MPGCKDKWKVHVMHLFVAGKLKTIGYRVHDGKEFNCSAG